MLSRIKSVFFAISLSAVALTPAFAIPVTLSFTVSGFTPAGPTDPVTGSFVYDAPSVTSAPNSLTSVDLTIDGHTYALDEVGFDSTAFGGVINTVDVVVPNTNDFFLVWNPSSSTPNAFDYAVPGISGHSFISTTFTRFSVTTATPAPEASTWAMMLIGYAGLGYAGYRRTRRAVSIVA